MSRLCVYMLPLSPDYSGAASALFDMNGICVMHDASGCTGNYTGYDEPRWLGSRSAVYCSGLRRMDAIMGNDEKYIQRTIEAAKELRPDLIAFLGSPVPMLIGTDLKGMAMEVENETGIPSFGFDTTGLDYYDKGASDVFLALAKRFCRKRTSDSICDQGKTEEQVKKKKVNILGILPIDFGNQGNPQRLFAFVEGLGYEINARYGIGSSVDQIQRTTEADLNIVVSKSGLLVAKYLQKKYDMPYVCGVPVADGTFFVERLQRALGGEEPGVQTEKTLTEVQDRKSTAQQAYHRGVLIIHEQIFANEIREMLSAQTERKITVATLFGLEQELAAPQDVDIQNESEAIREINSGKYAYVIADPEFYRVIHRDDVTLLGLPHVAVSSKLHWDEYMDYLGEDIPRLIKAIP